ncbi:MAG: NAD-dependent epimerase/dehydratase family protein [Chloroflexota bacterium]
MRALVTGGAGFIGHHLVSALIARGDEVVVLDDFSTGKRERLDAIRSSVELIEGDLRDDDALRRSTQGCEIVYHQAAVASVARSVADPLRTNSVNVEGTIRLMLACADAGVKRVVAAGSSSVYGATPELPRRETQRPDPQSPYAVSKLATEQYVHTIGSLHGMETVVLRYFNVFGPGQDPDSQYAAVVPLFVTAALADRAPTIYGDGRQSRDFTFIDNVVSANILGGTVPDVGQLTANVGCGGRFDLLELLEAIGAVVGAMREPVFEPTRPGDVRDSEADISVARNRLGYEVMVPFREGIERTVAWYEQNTTAPVRAA